MIFTASMAASRLIAEKLNRFSFAASSGIRDRNTNACFDTPERVRTSQTPFSVVSDALAETTVLHLAHCLKFQMKISVQTTNGVGLSSSRIVWRLPIRLTLTLGPHTLLSVQLYMPAPHHTNP